MVPIENDTRVESKIMVGRSLVEITMGQKG